MFGCKKRKMVGSPKRLSLLLACLCTFVLCSSSGNCQDIDGELFEITERIDEASRDQKRFEQFANLAKQRVELLRRLKSLQESIAKAERKLSKPRNPQGQIETLKDSIETSEIQVEFCNLKLEIVERRFSLEELRFELNPADSKSADEIDALVKRLDEAKKCAAEMSAAMVDGDEDRTEQLELKLGEIEREFDRRRDRLQLQFELSIAREEGDQEWIRELEMELKAIGFNNHDEVDPGDPSEKPSLEFPTAISLTESEIVLAGNMDFKSKILPRMQAACFDCHNESEALGDLNLERMVKQQPLVLNRSHWLNVIEQIKVRSMPPEDAQQPTEADRKLLLGWLINAIERFDYSSVRHAGVVPAKRLTHEEYNNTIRDLVGMDLRPADRFPSDLTSSSGFENNANSLFIQPITFERYVGAAESIVRAAWPVQPTSPEHRRVARKLLGEAESIDSDDAAYRVINQFASRAFRRPVGNDESRRLINYYDQRRGAGITPELALREVLQVVLISPSFLFRSESAPPDQDFPVPVGDWELASRLSYFLWASMPDDELFALAKSGRLSEFEVLEQQIDRMLMNPKSNTLGQLFASQWLGFDDLDRVQRDQIDNPWATDSLVLAMQNESAMLFNWIVNQNAPIDRLVDADFTFVNEELAAHYGIDGVLGDRMQRVSLANTARRGVLGHGSILATTSFPHRTSPVVRGNWILATLLGTPPPPPPPNASEFSERVAENERLSQRQKLELHRTNPNCYACHSQIDPLGFALEEFEWFGRHRPRREGRPVDALGRLPNGSEFRGLVGLSETLVDQRIGDLAEQTVRKLLAYALGRQLEYFDEATVQELTRGFVENGRRVRDLIHQIIHSEPFLKKQKSR